MLGYGSLVTFVGF